VLVLTAGVRLIVAAVVVPLALTASVAQAAVPVAISATVTQPAGPQLVATGQPIPIDVTLNWPGEVPSFYTYSAQVATTGPDGHAIEGVPLTTDPANPSHLTGAVNAAPGQAGWAATPGDYTIAIVGEGKPSPCKTEPVTWTNASGETVSGFGTVCAATPAAPRIFVGGLPARALRIVPVLTPAGARTTARQRAGKIGWRAHAPVTCTTPFLAGVFACTFKWHNAAGGLVQRTLTVAQDATGRVTVKR
jgi:hypothetical protein